MVLNTETALASALKTSYQGRAVEMMPSYAHTATLVKMRALLFDKLRVMTGPLYDGEAEAVLLKPLITALRKTVSSDQVYVVQDAYQLAATYGLIFEITKISQSKEISQAITAQSLISQPVVKAFVSKTPEVVDKQAMIEVWSKIDYILTNGLQYETSNSTPDVETPLQKLYDAQRFTPETLPNDVVNVWPTLLTTLKHGKGIPLEKKGRRVYMMYITEIMMRIDDLIERASHDEQGSSFSEAMTAMYWLKLYLDAIADYDVIFPASDLMVQSQAWVLTIKTMAAKMRKLFTDIAQVAMSFDIFLASRMWSEVRAFYEPILDPSSSVCKDVEAVWAANMALADKLLSPYAKSAAQEVIDQLKKYVQADHILPADEFKVAQSLLDAWSMSPIVDGVASAATGDSILMNIDTQGERSLSMGEVEIKLADLAASAATIEKALGYVKRSRDLLQLTSESDDIYHALLPSGQTWEAPYELEGTMRDLRVADFKRHDPLQLFYEKYSASKDKEGHVTSIQWKFSDLLLKPFYKIPQLQYFVQERTAGSRLIWPGMGDLPVGDVISASYLQQPLPAAYTCTRNVSFVSNTIASYLTVMSGHSGLSMSSRDYFRKLAAVIDRFPTTYAYPIVDALAAAMFVYAKKKDKDSDKLSLIQPTIPTVYGLPMKAMIQQNKAQIDLKAGLPDYVEHVELSNGHEYWFILHHKVPEPGQMRYLAYPYAKGVYLHIPVLKAVWESNQTAICNELGISLTKSTSGIPNDAKLDSALALIANLSMEQSGGVQMLQVEGWAPFLLNLPHLLCDYQITDSSLLSDNFLKYALLSVRVRYERAERMIYFASFLDNPVELLDTADYQKAASEADPSPLVNATPTDVPHDDPAPSSEPVRSEEEVKPAPTTLQPSTRVTKSGQKSGDLAVVVDDPDANLNRVGAITGSPIIAVETRDAKPTVEVKAPVEEAKKEAETGEQPAPLKGSPAPAQKHEGEEVEGELKLKKFWKKLRSDGTVDDVVESETCPSGYVPATLEEYQKFSSKEE